MTVEMLVTARHIRTVICTDRLHAMDLQPLVIACVRPRSCHAAVADHVSALQRRAARVWVHLRAAVAGRMVMVRPVGLQCDRRQFQ